MLHLQYSSAVQVFSKSTFLELIDWWRKINIVYIATWINKSLNKQNWNTKSIALYNIEWPRSGFNNISSSFANPTSNVPAFELRSFNDLSYNFKHKTQIFKN